MGTGSGILALAAAKLWPDAARITAVDIDPEAVAVTRQTPVTTIGKYLTVAVSNGYNSDLVRNNAPMTSSSPIFSPVR